MMKQAARPFTLALTLALLAMPLGKAYSQTTPTPAVTGTDPEPQSNVTGTDPEPQGGVVKTILVLLHLA